MLVQNDATAQCQLAVPADGGDPVGAGDVAPRAAASGHGRTVGSVPVLSTFTQCTVWANVQYTYGPGRLSTIDVPDRTESGQTLAIELRQLALGLAGICRPPDAACH